LVVSLAFGEEISELSFRDTNPKRGGSRNLFELKHFMHPFQELSQMYA